MPVDVVVCYIYMSLRVIWCTARSFNPSPTKSAAMKGAAAAEFLGGMQATLARELAGADPGFDRGGPDRYRPKLATVRSSVVRAK